MRIGLRVDDVAWAMPSVHSAAGRWSERRGLVVTVTCDGVEGSGEASPLPGMSRDDVARCRAALAGAAVVDWPDDVAGVIATAERVAIGAPAAAWALTCAVLDARARARGVSMAAMLGRGVQASVPLGALCDSPEAARAAVAGGMRCVKVKIGFGERRDVAGAARAVRAIRDAVGPDVELRADANRAFALGDVPALLRALGEHGVAYVEEPAAGIGASVFEPGGAPIALDESLAEPGATRWLDAALGSGAVAAVVLKPTVLGPRRALELADRAARAGVGVVVTHALEGPIGTACAAELALAVSTRAAGLARHAGLGDAVIPTIGDAELRDVARNGHGVLAGPATRASLALGAPRGERGQGTPSPSPIPPPSLSPPPSPSPSPSPSLSPSPSPSPFRSPRAGASASERRVEGPARRIQSLVAYPLRATVDVILDAFDAHRPIALLHPRADAATLAVQRAQLAAHPIPDGTCAILFTSGSTGAPRGVVLSRAGLLASAAASAANLGHRADDRWLACLPLAHTGGLTVILRAHLAGVPFVLHEGDFDAAAVARLAADERVTLASLVPTQLDALLDQPAFPPPSLRAVLLSGAAAPPPLLTRAAARGVPVLRTYGLTETWGQVATAPAPGIAPHALAGVTLRAGAPEAPAPITIISPTTMSGFLGEPPRDPAAPLVTSDLGYLDADGGLHVVGRADDVIITGGENVHPAQVEALLASAPGVAAACAFGVADARWGQLVAAAIVPTAPTSPGWRDSLDAWIAARLPPHLRPRRLDVVDALPLGPTGKVDRRAVAKLAARA